MIPRIVHPRLSRHGEQYAFAAGEKGRPLRIFLDSASITDQDSLEILLGFAHRDQIEVVSPDGSTPIQVTVHPFDPANEMALVDIAYPDGSSSHGGVWGRDIPRLVTQFAAQGEEAETERALCFALAAEESGADALATESPVLLNGVFPPNMIGSANAMPPRNAVALLGLYLRHNDDFTLAMSDRGAHMRFDRDRFYFVLMRELLPSAWRWFSALVEHAGGGRNEDLLMTAQSAMERVERALRARDRMHEMLQLPPSRGTATEAIFYFDVALMMLGGGFDGLARIAHAVHQFSTSPRTASWGSRVWLRKLDAVNAPLAALMAPGAPGRDARELVAILRNTIHSEALRTITHQSGGQRDELVVVPREIEQELEEVVGRISDAASFGIERRNDGRLYIRPGLYIEVALPFIASALNAIMDATPVEQLANVDAANLRVEPRPDRVWTPENRQAVWLLGGVG